MGSTGIKLGNSPDVAKSVLTPGMWLYAGRSVWKVKVADVYATLVGLFFAFTVKVSLKKKKKEYLCTRINITHRNMSSNIITQGLSEDF